MKTRTQQRRSGVRYTLRAGAAVAALVGAVRLNDPDSLGYERRQGWVALVIAAALIYLLGYWRGMDR